MDDELAFAGTAGGGIGNIPCAVCGNRTAMCCSACEAVFYCSAACQQKDWREHWRVCGTLAAPGSPDKADKGGALATMQQAERFRSRSPTRETGRAIMDDGEGFEVALPQSNFAQAAAAQASATAAARDRRLRLRVSAVLAARENRHQDALQHAAEAYEVAQRLGSLYSEGKSMEDEGGVAELEGPALVELLIIVRAALANNDFGTGLGFLEMLCATVDRLAGVGGNPSMLQPSEAATLLLVTSELCALYNHEDRAEDYAHAYLGVARLAHGEGSKEVGDAHGFLCGLFVRRRRYEEAVLHASSTLKIRQRHASYGAEKPVADAYWNLSVLQYQLGQHRAALDSLEACREIHVRLSGEGVATSNVDVALGQVWTTLGEAGKAMRSYRQAVRWRQRTLGFAHAETRRAAGLLAAAEIEANAEEEWRRDVEAEADEEDGPGPVPRPRPRQRPRGENELDPPPYSPGVASSPRMVQQPRQLQGEPTHQAIPPSMLPSPNDGASTPNVSTPNVSTPNDARSPIVEPLGQGGDGLYFPPAKGKTPLPPGAVECIAGKDVTALGLKPSSAPPSSDPITLREVDEGSWASSAGLKVGMEILSINGMKPQTMSSEEFKAALRGRPLTIVCAPGTSKLPASKAPPVEKPTAKQASKTTPADKPPSPRGKATPADKPPSPGKTTGKAAPVDKSPSPRPADKPPSPRAKATPAAKPPSDPATSDLVVHSIAVADNLKSLGCSFTPSPMHVKLVEQGSWAEKVGIKVGWKLATVNGKDPNEMSKEAFVAAMKGRPLKIAFDSKAKQSPNNSNNSNQAASKDKAGTASKTGLDFTPTSSLPKKDPPKVGTSKPMEPGKNPDAYAKKVDAVVKPGGDTIQGMKRSELIKAIYQVADRNKNNLLTSAEFFVVAQAFGFPKPFDSNQWDEEYVGTCEDYGSDPKVGLKYESFEDCVEDDEGDYNVDDNELRRILTDLRKKLRANSKGL